MTVRVRRPKGIGSFRVSWMHVAVVIVGLSAVVLNLLVLDAKVATQPVAIAAIDLAPGSVIGATALGFAHIQAPSELVATLITQEESSTTEGLVVTRSISAGELLSRTDLRPAGAPSDLRAYAIPIPPERAVAGSLIAGDRVDVMVADDGAAAYLATGLEVLEVTGGAGGIGLSSFSVTVAADAETILRLAAALDSGTVSLARSTGAAPPTVWEIGAEAEEDGDA